MANIYTMSDERIFITFNVQLFLETLVLGMRGKTNSYSFYMKKIDAFSAEYLKLFKNMFIFLSVYPLFMDIEILVCHKDTA